MNAKPQHIDEFEALTRPLIQWLNDNHHPHTTIIIDPTSASLWEGMLAYTTADYLHD